MKPRPNPFTRRLKPDPSGFDILTGVTKLSMRPTERRIVTLTADEICQRFTTLLHENPERVHGHVLGDHITLRVPFEQRHFWSPWYNLDVAPDETDPNQTILHLRFSPHPSIWTSIALGYLALIVVATLAACFGFAQIIIDSSPTALWAIPLCILLAVGIFIAAQVGQSLAKEQMALLDTMVQETLGDSDPADGPNPQD
jgi:hypothetical protein